MLNFGNKEFRNLQEQVLKNAQDIETLKGRENLQIVIVEELPEVGNPNYIYLVAKDDGEQPDIYNEYIWLEDEERYEEIGGVSIDLTNYVTLDSAQTITAIKTIKEELSFIDKTETSTVVNSIKTDEYGGMLFARNGSSALGIGNSDVRYYGRHLLPSNNNTTYSLGNSSARWKDAFLSGKVDLGTKVANRTNTVYMDLDNYDGLRFYVNANNVLTVYDNAIYIKCNFIPNVTNNFDIGSNTRYFNNLYLVGNISDGTNTVSVANISSKVTSTQASGTFDANGESTIDISGGTPEGLFVFTYGNCECLLRLTATMVQNADVTPIRVSCPMITSGSPYLGWLEIERSSNTLTISVKDGNIHVDSGFAWTLTKTNLL